MESVDNSQFNPPNYFSREDERPKGTSKRLFESVP